MKVTVNACRKKRIKVDVTAVTTRRDVIRIPVKRMDSYSGSEQNTGNDKYTDDLYESFDESELSAIFDSSEFEDRYQENDLPEVFVKPVRVLNELADNPPGLEDLPPYFNPRIMTEEEELIAYSAPVRLAEERTIPEESRDKNASREHAGAEKVSSEKDTCKKNITAPVENTAENRKSGVQDIAENYTTEELLAIIESQQQEKEIRDKEQVEKKKLRDIEAAERNRKLKEEKKGGTLGNNEVSGNEDTLFMWWSEIDSTDPVQTSGFVDTADNEDFTQVQITDDIPKAKWRADGDIPADISSGDSPAAEDITSSTEDQAVRDISGEVFSSIRDAFSYVEDSDEYDTDVNDNDEFSDDAEIQDISDDAEQAADDYDPDLSDEDEYYDEFEEDDSDTYVNVRYFDRDMHGSRVEVERSEAIGQEVVVIDNESGKMKRICGIIKHGQPDEDNVDAAETDNADETDTADE